MSEPGSSFVSYAGVRDTLLPMLISRKLWAKDAERLVRETI